MTDQPETLSQQRFGKFAEAYVTSITHGQGIWLARLLELAWPQPDWAVLDVATGGGHTALTFAPHVARVTASDITPAMLQAAEKNLTEKGAANVDFRLANAEGLPFDDASFDLVTCRIAPHHFDDVTQFVREAARVLRHTGTLLVQDIVMPEDTATAGIVEAFEKLRDPSHNRALTETQWRAAFADAGLMVTHVEEVVKVSDFAAWTARQEVTPSTKACLEALVSQASLEVLAWMQPTNWGTDEATFTCHYVIAQGVKE